MRRFPFLFSLFAVFALALVPAQASVIQYTLTSQHCTGACGPTGATFGTVTLTDTVANTVQVTVSLNSPYEFVHTGFDVTVAFDLLGNPTISAGSITSGWSLFNGGVPTTIHMDGTGDFEYGVVCDVCGTGSSNAQPGSVNFTLTGTGLSAASFADVNTNFFAVDIFNSATSGVGAGNTGLVDATGGGIIITSTPEPGSFALLGGGLVALSLVLRKRAKR